MAVPAPAKVARALAATAAVLVLLWCVHFRGGLSLGSPTNKGLIFTKSLKNKQIYPLKMTHCHCKEHQETLNQPYRTTE